MWLVPTTLDRLPWVKFNHTEAVPAAALHFLECLMADKQYVARLCVLQAKGTRSAAPAMTGTATVVLNTGGF